MKEPARKLGYIKHLPFAWLAISIGLLLVGLWPFQFWPSNNVCWIFGQPGLRFDRYGIAYGLDPLFTPRGGIDLAKPFTIQLKLRPHENRSNYLPRILSAYDSSGRELFFLGQWKSEFILRIRDGERYFQPRYRETGFENIHKDVTRTITICSDEKTFEIYADGALEVSKPGFNQPLRSNNREPAWLVLGNSPTGKSPWQGDLLSLSIYSKALLPGKIASPGIEPVVRYRFSEGSGTKCRGGVNPRHDLFIPTVFRAPAKQVLFPPWRDQHYNRSFWMDVFVNILGFIPFGFFMCAWLRKDGERNRSSVTVMVVLMGAGISLFIELLQVYLPTRDSSLTDLMNNILGTYIGVWLFIRDYKCVKIPGTSS